MDTEGTWHTLTPPTPPPTYVPPKRPLKPHKPELAETPPEIEEGASGPPDAFFKHRRGSSIHGVAASTIAEQLRDAANAAGSVNPANDTGPEEDDLALPINVRRPSISATRWALAIETANALVEDDAILYKTAFAAMLLDPDERQARAAFDSAVEQFAATHKLVVHKPQTGKPCPWVWMHPTKPLRQPDVPDCNSRTDRLTYLSNTRKAIKLKCPNTDAVLRELEEEIGRDRVELEMGPSKCDERIWEKSRLLYNDDVSRVTDLERRSIIARSFVDARHVIEFFPPEIEVLRIKNRFSRENKTAKESASYRDLQLVCRLIDSQELIEIQIHIEAFHKLKKKVAGQLDARGSSGHERYIEFRSLKEAADYRLRNGVGSEAADTQPTRSTTDERVAERLEGFKKAITEEKAAELNELKQQLQQEADERSRMLKEAVELEKAEREMRGLAEREAKAERMRSASEAKLNEEQREKLEERLAREQEARKSAEQKVQEGKAREAELRQRLSDEHNAQKPPVSAEFSSPTPPDESGTESAESPCGEYRVDLTASFGLCKCGFPKAKHNMEPPKSPPMSKKDTMMSPAVDVDVSTASSSKKSVVTPLFEKNRHAFLSYEKGMQQKIIEIKKLLDEHGIECWMAPDKLAESSNYDNVAEGLKGNRCFCYAFTWFVGCF